MSRWHRSEWDFLPEHAFMARPFGGMTLEGSSSSTPAPDPKLVEAQVKNLGVQDEMIQQIIANTNEMAPLQKEQTEFALETSRTSWEQAQADREYSLQQRDKLTSLQNQMVDEAKAFNTEAKQEELAGQAAADISQAYTSAQRTQTAEMARMGVNPSDAKFGSAANALTANTALATAQAKNSARTQARAEGQALTDRAANALAGYPSMSMSATAATQGYGTAGQTIANNGLAGLNSGYGQAGNAAAQATNSASSAYNAQTNAWAVGQNAANASASNWGSLAGIGVSAAITI